MCQKVFNALAVVSFLLSGTLTAGVVYVYVNQEDIKNQLMDEALDAATEKFGGLFDGSLFGFDGEDGFVDSPTPTLPF